MSSPAVIYRELTVNFARAVNPDRTPQVVQVVLTPLSTPTLVPAGRTFVEAPVAREVVLGAAVNTVVFRLVPSDLAGLSERLLYRIAWRTGGATGRTFSYDFAMPDVDLTFEQLNSLDYVLEGEVYLQQADLGKAGRVAALNSAGQVIDAAGIPVAQSADLTALSGALNVEVLARQQGDNQLRTELNASLDTQINQVITTTGNTVNVARAEFSQQIAAEAATRLGADTALTGALAAKADLVGGKIPMAQIPEAARTQGVQVPNEAAMLALTSAQVQQFDFAIRPDGVFALLGTNPSMLSSWSKLNRVSSVNGLDGDVVLSLSTVAAAGGSIAQNQVTGLTDALNAKASTAALGAATTRITALETDPTVVKTVGGVIPFTLNDTRMAYLDITGQFITRKDGTIISGAGGAVASVNAKVGNVVLTLTDVATAGGAVPQSSVTGLVAALDGKVSLTDARLSDARTPSSHAATHTAAGSDPLTLSTAQVSGLSTTLTNYGNRIGSLETRVTTIESGGGGGGGGGINVGTLSWFSSPSPTGVFSGLVLHSPFGYNPTNLAANAQGYYYDPAGAASADVRWPYITPNGHLELRKWDESGPPDPVLATAADLQALSNTVNGKAASADLTALTTVVGGKADQSALSALTTVVGGKADQSALSALNTVVNGKAAQSALDALALTVSGQATTLAAKADLVSGRLPVGQLPQTIPQSNIENLAAALSARAPLVNNVVPVANIPTGIPQSSISGLSTTLAAKADLVDGKLATSQLPGLALTNTQVVANRAAMLALTNVEPGDVCVISATVDQGSYILTASPASTFTNWTLLSNPVSPVSSVNGRTGTVVLSAADVGALASSGSILQSQVTGLTAALDAKVNTTTYTPALAARPTWGTTLTVNPPLNQTLEAVLSASAGAKQRVDYVATALVPSLNGQQSIDGVVVPLGSTVLLTAQSNNPVLNGIWQVNSGAWTRVTDMASGSYLVRGTLVAVASGNANANTLWQATSVSGWVDTNANAWTRLGSVATTFTAVAGNGILITGTAPTSNFAVRSAPAVQVGTGTVADPFVNQSQGISVSAAGVAVDTAIVARKFVGSIPGGNKEVRIYHNLNTRRVLVQVQEVSTGTGVLVGWTASNVNYIDLEFSVAPLSGQWAVIVIG